MSWKLVKSIQQEQGDLRLVIPFGLNLQLGQVVSVGKDGGFTIEGNARSLLGIGTGTPLSPSPPSVNMVLQGGKNTKWEFRLGGKASTLFPDLPSATAGIDISFESSEGWILAFTGRQIHAITDVNKFRERILDVYRRKVWKEDWVLITTVSTVERMTLLASKSPGTRIALSLNADVSDGAADSAKFTADAQVVAVNQAITQCIISERMTAFCAGLRLKDHWFRDPGFSQLTHVKTSVEGVDVAWEDMDEGILPK